MTEHVEPVKDDDDFLAFWREHKPPETKRILGVTVVVPTDLPLNWQARMEQARESDSEDDVRGLLAELFGADVMDKWIENKVSGPQMWVLMTWAITNGMGRPTTFAEAAALAEEARKVIDQGKAQTVPNRADRRASLAIPASASTGRWSKPTSNGSTPSTAPAWPTSEPAAS